MKKQLVALTTLTISSALLVGCSNPDEAAETIGAVTKEVLSDEEVIEDIASAISTIKEEQETKENVSKPSEELNISSIKDAKNQLQLVFDNFQQKKSVENSKHIVISDLERDTQKFLNGESELLSSMSPILANMDIYIDRDNFRYESENKIIANITIANKDFKDSGYEIADDIYEKQKVMVNKSNIHPDNYKKERDEIYYQKMEEIIISDEYSFTLVEEVDIEMRYVDGVWKIVMNDTLLNAMTGNLFGYLVDTQYPFEF